MLTIEKQRLAKGEKLEGGGKRELFIDDLTERIVLSVGAFLNKSGKCNNVIVDAVYFNKSGFRFACRSPLNVLSYVLNGFANGGDFFSLIRPNRNVELLFKLHYEFNHIQRVGTEVVFETGL